MLFDTKMANCHKTKKEWDHHWSLRWRPWLVVSLGRSFFSLLDSPSLYYTGKKWECEYYKSAQVAAFKKAGHLALGWLQDFEKNYPMYFNIGCSLNHEKITSTYQKEARRYFLNVSNFSNTFRIYLYAQHATISSDDDKPGGFSIFLYFHGFF